MYNPNLSDASYRSYITTTMVNYVISLHTTFSHSHADGGKLLDSSSSCPWAVWKRQGCHAPTPPGHQRARWVERHNDGNGQSKDSNQQPIDYRTNSYRHLNHYPDACNIGHRDLTAWWFCFDHKYKLLIRDLEGRQ